MIGTSCGSNLFLKQEEKKSQPHNRQQAILYIDLQAAKNSLIAFDPSNASQHFPDVLAYKPLEHNYAPK